MGFEPVMGDDAILAEIGKRLARRRVELDFTQAVLAEQAGISKRTVERLENGESIQMSTMIRILRILELLDAFDAVIPKGGPRPLDLLRTRGRERKRASSKKGESPSNRPWSWGDGE